LDELEEWSQHQDLARSRSIFFHATRVTAVTRKWYTNEGVQRSANQFFLQLSQFN